MTDYMTILASIIGILLISIGLALWFVRTFREFLHDLNRVLVTYKEAKADKKLTHVEKDEILNELELLLVNLNKNVKKLLLLNF